MAKSKKQTEPIESENVQPATPKFSEELVATLVKYPHIDSVYIDEEGNWHFAAKPGFTAISREDILNG